jgi:adenosylhomocysteine nucleosidase
MMGLVLATEREARPLLNLLAAKVVTESPFQLWRAVVGEKGQEVRILVSGMGKVAAAAATANLLSTVDIGRLINLGVCGALVDREDLTPGALCQVDRAVEGDHSGFGGRPADPVVCQLVDAPHLVGVDLVTTDRPVFDVQRRATLSALGQVVDMEGAAVARTAAWLGVPCTLIKGITDPAGSGDRRQLLGNLDRVAEALAGLCLEIFGKQAISTGP